MAYSKEILVDNKLMANTTLPGRPPSESVCLSVSEQDNNSTPKRSRRRRHRLILAVEAAVVVIVLISLALLEFGVIPQTKLGFYCKDPSLSFKYSGDTISIGFLLIGAFIGPLLIIAGTEIHRERSINKNCGAIIWQWFREYLIGLHFNLVIVEVGKVVVGEHRPHFFSTCVPDALDTCREGDYVTQYKCTNTYYSNYVIVDSSRSFPSGHASTAVYMALFCACFIHWRLPLWRSGRILKPFLIVLCMVWGVVCSLTRITDHRHHWWDVLAGTALGVAVAYYTITALCKDFYQPPVIVSKPQRPSASTTTLLDVKNRDAASVII